MRNTYESPLSSRYASKEMLELFSPDMKFKTWRRLWIALAESEKELGLDITDEQIEELRKFKNEINYETAQQKEKELRHDVMAHIHAYGEQCPAARPIIHLGATSCFVGDNTDIIIMTEGLNILRSKLINIIANLSEFALKYKNMPTLGFTHFQPAQLTTVGKRATLWIQELLMDIEDLEFTLKNMKLLGSKGTTGTQASFLALFNGDNEKVKKLDSLIAAKMGFAETFAVSGQTYPRKLDSRVYNVLGAIAQSAYKFSNDIRLLQSMKEIEEPFEEKQVGSSAMAYKRNPMRTERMGSLARYVIVNALNPSLTAGTQWFERTLDDSANKRITVSEGFLATDAILNIYLNVSSALVVYPNVINQHVLKELPFMATENIIMEAVKKGGDRQELHEQIRIHSMEAARLVKEEGKENDLIERISADKMFNMTYEELISVLEPTNYIGRSPQQVQEFFDNNVKYILEKELKVLGLKAQLSV